MIFFYPILPRNYVNLPLDAKLIIRSYLEDTIFVLYDQRNRFCITDEFWYFYCHFIIETHVRILKKRPHLVSFERVMKLLCHSCQRRTDTVKHPLIHGKRYCATCFRLPQISVISLRSASEAYDVPLIDIVKHFGSKCLVRQIEVEHLATPLQIEYGRRRIRSRSRSNSIETTKSPYPYQSFCKKCYEKASIHCIIGACGRCCNSIMCPRHATTSL